MKWSWKLGEFRGIAVYMHATFLILVAFIVLSHWTEGHSLGKTLEGVGFIPALFGCMVVNVSLLIFNMLPAFPMDGGRVLRALLATRLQYARATQIAASIGQAMALVFAFLGFFGNPFLMFIALFVWIGAAQEASMATMKAALGGIPVSHAMMTNFSKLRPKDSLQRAIELILATPQQDFPVVEDSRVVGILPSRDLMIALQKHGPDLLVERVMRRDFVSLDSHEMLDVALARIHTAECCMTAPVIQRGALVGLLTADNVGEFLLIASALNAHQSRIVAA